MQSREERIAQASARVSREMVSARDRPATTRPRCVLSDAGDRHESIREAAQAEGVSERAIRRSIHLGWKANGKTWFALKADHETLSDIVALARCVIQACANGDRIQVADAIGLARKGFGMYEVELRDQAAAFKNERRTA